LSGRILPVGGVREKILAARRAGVKTVIFPLKNRVDLDNLGDDVTRGLEICLVDRIEEVTDRVLLSASASLKS
jgi:ATP-dependent Lon protease